MKSIVTEKRCCYCHEIKPLSEFRKRNKLGNVYNAGCNLCRKIKWKEWVENNRERYLRDKKLFRINNLEKERERDRLYKKNNNEKRKEQKRIRRAKQSGALGKITSKEWRELLQEADYSCLKCGSKNNLSLDHIKPLNNGGTHTKDNAQVLCVSCNSKKGIHEIDYRKKHKE